MAAGQGSKITKQPWRQVLYVFDLPAQAKGMRLKGEDGLSHLKVANEGVRGYSSVQV